MVSHGSSPGANRASADGLGNGAAGGRRGTAGDARDETGAAGGGHGHRGLRLLAVLTVIIGVVVLAAAAFVLSYAGVHDIVRAAGLRTGLARFYPALPDALLVVACAAALALRNARWWARWFAWLTILLLVALVGTADAVHAMAIKLPRRPTAAAVAIMPWVLLLLGLQLWLSVLRHTRTETPSSAAPSGVPPSSGVPSSGVPPSAEHPAAVSSPAVPSPAVPSPAAQPASAAPSPANPAGGVSGLDLILPPYRDAPDDGGTDVATDLAVDAEPEPDDPAAAAADDYDAAFDTEGGAVGGYHDFAAPPGPGDTGEPRGREETEYARPPLGAPVPAEGHGKPGQSSDGTAAPQAVPPNTVPPKADEPSQPPEAADFRRVRSSPLPPGESED